MELRIDTSSIVERMKRTMHLRYFTVLGPEEVLHSVRANLALWKPKLVVYHHIGFKKLMGFSLQLWDVQTRVGLQWLSSWAYFFSLLYSLPITIMLNVYSRNAQGKLQLPLLSLVLLGSKITFQWNFLWRLYLKSHSFLAIIFLEECIFSLVSINDDFQNLHV